MSPNAKTSVETSTGEVMASIDESAAGERFIIADISRDDAFLSVPLKDALAACEWR